MKYDKLQVKGGRMIFSVGAAAAMIAAQTVTFAAAYKLLTYEFSQVLCTLVNKPAEQASEVRLLSSDSN